MTTEQARKGSISEARFMDLMRMPRWSDEQGTELMLAFVGSRGKAGATEDDIFKWFEHLERLKVELAITMSVAYGAIRMTWVDGEAHFSVDETAQKP